MAAGRDIHKRSVRTRVGNVEYIHKKHTGMFIQYLFLHAINKWPRKN